MSFRLSTVLSDETAKRFENMRNASGLTKPKFIEFLIAKKDFRPQSIIHREIISSCSGLNNTLRAAISSDKVFSDEERIVVFEKIKEIEKNLEKLQRDS